MKEKFELMVKFFTNLQYLHLQKFIYFLFFFQFSVMIFRVCLIKVL